MCFIFKIDNEIKQEFLNSKPTNTAESDSFVLRSADEYEDIICKPIYNMNYIELKEMIVMQYNNSSVKTIVKNISILKTYVDFCVNRNIVLHGENRLAIFNIDDIKEFVNQNAFLNKYITKEQLREYQNILYNPQDQLFLELLFIGAKGRTIKNCTSEEIINLTIDDIDEKNNMLTLTQNDGKYRFLEVEPHTIELIKDVYEQEIYVENNGMETNNPRFSKPRELKINKVEHYIFRVPSKDKFLIFNNVLFNSRMKRIQDYLGNKHLTQTSIYFSGMLNMAMDIYKEKGEIQKDDLIKICVRYNYEIKYWYNIKSLFEQYLELYKKK